jgi:hypothetical protein
MGMQNWFCRGCSTKVMDDFDHKRLYFPATAIGFACLPQSDRQLTNMRQLAIWLSLLVAPVVCAQTSVREIGFEQAREVALAVALHDNITVDDRNVVINSMDTRNEAGFIPGYYSFSIIRESDTSTKPDETIRMYVVSKRTADTWELNLCRHYEFPELQKLQREAMQTTGARPEEADDMPRAIGCSTQAANMKPST